MKTCEVTGFLQMIFERKVPEKGQFLFLLSLYIYTEQKYKRNKQQFQPFQGFY
jgi:hypothetical protein